MLIHLAQVVTSRAPQDIDLWTNHINGAMALLEMRGPDQLKTETGLRLFMHLRYQIVCSSPQLVISVRPLTSAPLRSSAACNETFESPSPSWRARGIS
jgi:hypothetical protein